MNSAVRTLSESPISPVLVERRNGSFQFLVESSFGSLNYVLCE